MGLPGSCAVCKFDPRTCRDPAGQQPASCIALHYIDALYKAAAEYEKAEIDELVRKAESQKAEGCVENGREPHYRFTVKTRVQKLIDFLRDMGFRRLGLAFCAGLRQEAAIVAKVFENSGFEVVSVICKVGGANSKNGSNQHRCHSIAQAEILNQAGTEFNLLLGLCVGNESLFIKYSKAMVSVFAVDDMAIGLNPLAGAVLFAPIRHGSLKANE